MIDAVSVPAVLAGVHMPSCLLQFDKHGACTSPAARTALLQRVLTTRPTDILLFAHGWNEGFGSAVGMAAEMMRQLEALCAQHPPQRRFDPLFVGLLWPSIWLASDSGPAIASGGAAVGVEEVLSVLAQQVAVAGGAAGLARIYTLLAAPAIDDSDAAELARLIAPAFGLMVDEAAALPGRDTVADDVLRMMRAMEAAWLGSAHAPASATAPSDDIDDFSRPAGPAAAPDGSTRGAARLAGGGGRINPRVALRLFSLFQMKDRAGTVGNRGVAALLRDVLAISPPADAAAPPRVHGIGHSFGCKVLLSAACAEPLARPLASLLLLQPAVSHLCFADVVPGTGQPGGYREALSETRVLPPIVSTYSRNDRPLHDAFHLAVRRADDLGEAQIAADTESTDAGPPPSRFSALGGYGPRRAGQLLVDPLPAAGTPLVLPKPVPPIVAFDGSAGAINGHGDVVNPAAAWLLHQLVFRDG